jgi:hypothetical protein
MMANGVKAAFNRIQIGFGIGWRHGKEEGIETFFPRSCFRNAVVDVVVVVVVVADNGK